MPRDSFVLKIQRELCHPKYARKISGLLRNARQGPFPEGPETFRAHLGGDITLFVSSKRRFLEARNFAVLLIFVCFTTIEKTSFTDYRDPSLTNGFSGLWRNEPPAS